MFLLHGPNVAGSQALTKRLERAMGPDAERIDLDGAALKIDPARLADEAASISLFGGARWIRVTLAGDEALPAIEGLLQAAQRSEEHTSELQSLMRISYAVFCLKKKKKHT